MTHSTKSRKHWLCIARRTWSLSIIGGLLLASVSSDAAERRIPSDAAAAPPIELSMAAPRPSSAHTVTGFETVIPVSVEAGALIVEVMVNGRGPFPMMFDTGAQNAVTREMAAALGIAADPVTTARDSGDRVIPIGLTRTNSIRLGDVEVTNQPFAVVELPQYLTDRGPHPALAGIIGGELMQRFAVKLDYQNHTLSLKPAAEFHYNGAGVRLPLKFSDTIPIVFAAADGIGGLFAIDTGSTGALTLQRGFVQRSGIETRHGPTLRIKSIGAAGPFDTLLTRLDGFDIAGSRIDGPAARFPSRADGENHAGDFDGTVGYEILRQFIVTFDYQRREVWLERSRAFGTPTGRGTAGFQAISAGGQGFAVITVIPDTPAAMAGMQIGDIITEIEGRSTASMNFGEFAEMMRRPVGALVHLNLSREGTRHPVVLTLSDVLAMSSRQ